MNVIVSTVLAYLIGSVIFSIPVGRLIRGTDVRQYGSGNAGATNTMRVLGVGPAILVLALDIAKAVLAIWIAKWLNGSLDLWAEVAAGLAVIIGHNWPVYFRFRGGKGIATTIGVVATLCFVPGAIAGAIGILVIVFTRYVSLGSLLFTLLLPIALLSMHRPIELVILSIAILALAIWRHRLNIVRLFQGTESKLGSRSNKGAA